MLTNPDKCRVFGYKVPLYFFFVLSGALCDIVQAVVYLVLYNIYPDVSERATVCWTASYTISVSVRHTSHRLLVFGDYEGTYWSSLTKTYASYLSSIVVSIFTNYLLVLIGAGHVYAWLITMIWTGVYNYFVLKSSWRKSPEAKDPELEIVSTAKLSV